MRRGRRRRGSGRGLRGVKGKEMGMEQEIVGLPMDKEKVLGPDSYPRRREGVVMIPILLYHLLRPKEKAKEKERVLDLELAPPWAVRATTPLMLLLFHFQRQKVRTVLTSTLLLLLQKRKEKVLVLELMPEWKG